MNSALVRTGAVSGLLVIAAVLAGFRSTSQDAATPPASAVPPVVLSTSVTQAAAAYQAYVRQAASLTPAFENGDSVQAELRQGEAYEPKSLARDTVAYAAVVALQEPSFVQGVRVYAIDPAQRADMIRKIEQDPHYASAFPGAQAAATLIAAKLGADGDAIAHAGYEIKQSAYTIQHKKWSTEFVKDREGRLAMAKELSATAPAAPDVEGAAMKQAAESGQGLGLVAPATGATHAGVQPPYTEGVNRGLAIAALAALGAAGDSDAAYIEPLMDENVGQPCLSLAKMNLFQCLAVSKPHYEDVFCLGQHALMDTGQCVAKEAGVVPTNYEPAPEPKASGKKAVHHKGKATRKRHA